LECDDLLTILQYLLDAVELPIPTDLGRDFSIAGPWTMTFVCSWFVQASTDPGGRSVGVLCWRGLWCFQWHQRYHCIRWLSRSTTACLVRRPTVLRQPYAGPSYQ